MKNLLVVILYLCAVTCVFAQDPNPGLNIEPINCTCKGRNDGTIKINIVDNRPYIFRLINDVGNPSGEFSSVSLLKSLSEGIYYLESKEVNGEFQGNSEKIYVNGPLIIGSPKPIEVNNEKISPVTTVANNGMYQFSISGGNSDFAGTLIHDTGTKYPVTITGNDGNISGLAPGRYYLIVEDSKKCSETKKDIFIGANNDISIDIRRQELPKCTDQLKKSKLTVVVNKGTAPYNLKILYSSGSIQNETIAEAGKETEVQLVDSGDITVSAEDKSNIPIKSQPITFKIPTLDCRLKLSDLTKTNPTKENSKAGRIAFNVDNGIKPYEVKVTKNGIIQKNISEINFDYIEITDLEEGHYNIVILDKKGAIGDQNVELTIDFGDFSTYQAAFVRDYESFLRAHCSRKIKLKNIKLVQESLKLGITVATSAPALAGGYLVIAPVASTLVMGVINQLAPSKSLDIYRENIIKGEKINQIYRKYSTDAGYFLRWDMQKYSSYKNDMASIQLLKSEITDPEDFEYKSDKRLNKVSQMKDFRNSYIYQLVNKSNNNSNDEISSRDR